MSKELLTFAIVLSDIYKKLSGKYEKILKSDSNDVSLFAGCSI